MNAQTMTHTTRHATRALTEREVSDLLGLSVATLRAWRHRGQGPRFLRLGRAVRYLPADLEDFVRASAVDAHPDPSPGRDTSNEERLS
jgi:predicted DNA-binding transcriptional regulator AlpA